VVHGKVTRVVPFGAFVQVEGGIEGIVPNTELSDRKGVESKDVVQPGQEVEVKILNIRPEERRLTLSLAQAMQEAERREYEQYMRAQRSDRPTLGDVFGDVLEERKAELEAAQKKQRRAPRRRAAKAGAEVAAAAAGAAEAPPEPQPESPAEAPAEPEPPAAEASSPAAEQVEVPEPGPEASGESAEAPAEGDETPS
jgi:predicted RNA-binding protein with RPS1 domain